MNQMKKRVLITGVAGFLGSHLCDKFVKEGYNVIGMDNFITGSSDNIKHLEGNPNFKFIEHDVCNHISIDEPLDYILHFASPASPIDYLKIPIQTLKVGSLGIHNCLGLALAKKATVLIASTSEVYGDPLVHPQTEDYYGNVNPVGPRGVYDEAKRFQEAITMAYHTFHKVPVRIARIFNTYGPRDQIDGLYKLLLSNYSEPVNIGNPSEISIRDFADEIIKLTNTSQKVIYKELPINDPMQRQPNINLAQNILGWEPKVGREEGLQKTLEYFKSLPEEKWYSIAHKTFEKYIN